MKKLLVLFVIIAVAVISSVVYAETIYLNCMTMRCPCGAYEGSGGNCFRCGHGMFMHKSYSVPEYGL